MVATARGTSPQLAQDLYQISAALESQRRGQKGGSATGTPTSDFYKGELDAQRQSRIGQAIQKITNLPGMALSTASRTKNLDQVIGGLAKRMGKMGKGADANQLADLLTKVGGLSYLGTTGVMQTPQLKRAAYERQFKPQLGAVGTASSALTSMSMLNRALAVPRVAGLMYGGGMPASVQSSLGMYSAGKPMAAGALKMAGMEGAAAKAAGMGGMGGLAMGMAPMIAAQIGMSMWKQKKLARITAQRGAGGQEEKKTAWGGQLDSQINMLVSRGQIQPADQLQITLLKWIESHTSVMPEIWAEQKYIREEKEKGLVGAATEYDKALGKDQKLGALGTIFDFIEGRSAVVGAKYNPFGQLFNFLSTGKMPREFQDELKAAYGMGTDREEMKKEAKRLGLGMDQHRLLGTSSKQIMDLAPNYETKMLMILGSQFDVARLMASELLTIRQSGFGISDTALKSDDYERSAIGKLWDAVKGAPGAITNLPGVNALWNIMKFPFTLGSKVRTGVGTAFRKARTGLLGADTEEMLSSDEELRKKAGIFKSPQERAYEFVGRGMPDIMEEMRSVNWLQLQELVNIYHVAQAHYNHVSGMVVPRDDSYGKRAKKLFWSVSAGKYVNEKGFAEQQQQDMDKMQIAMEKSFKGGFTDTLLFGVDRALKAAGIDAGIGTVEERLAKTASGLSFAQQLPFQMDKDTPTWQKALYSPFTGIAQEEMIFTPEEQKEAALYRQRAIYGKSRAKQDFFDKNYERALMDMNDFWPRFKIAMAEAQGGTISAAAMTTLGIGATMLTGGLAAPVMAAGAGGLMGMMPSSMELLRQQQAAFSEVRGEGTAGKGDARMIMGVATSGYKDISQEKKKYIKDWVKKNVAGDLYATMKFDDDWYDNINNVSYMMNALSAMEMEKSGFYKGAIASTPSPGAGVSTSTGTVYGMSHVYEILNEAQDVKSDKSLDVRLVGITENVYTDENPIPIAMSKNVVELFGAGEGYTQVSANEWKKVSGFKTGGPITKTGKVQAHAGEHILTKDDVQTIKESSKILEAQRKRQEMIEGMLSDAERAETGGIASMIGHFFLGNWGKSATTGGKLLQNKINQNRDIRAELQEVEEKKERKTIHGYFETMITKLTEIDENTEDLGPDGKGAKSGKSKNVYKKLLGFLGGGLGKMGAFLPLLLPMLIGGGLGGAGFGLGGAALGAGALGLMTAPGLMARGALGLGKAGFKGLKGLTGKAADKMGLFSRYGGSIGQGAKIGGVKGAAKVIGAGAGRFALPLSIALGAFDIVTDMIKGWKSEEGGGLWGALKGIFSTSKEGGIMSAFKGMGKYAAIGAAAGSIVPGIGTLAGGLLGSGLGAIMGFLGEDRVKGINDFYKTWTGGKLISGLFPGKYGEKFSYALGNIPIIGPLAGGIMGSIVDAFAGTFSENPVEKIKKGIIAGVPRPIRRFLFGDEEPKTPKITKEIRERMAHYKSLCTNRAYTTLMAGCNGDMSLIDQAFKILSARGHIVPAPSGSGFIWMGPGEITEKQVEEFKKSGPPTIHLNNHVKAVKRYKRYKQLGDKQGMAEAAHSMSLFLDLPPDEQVKIYDAQAKNAKEGISPDDQARKYFTKNVLTPSQQMGEGEFNLGVAEEVRKELGLEPKTRKQGFFNKVGSWWKNRKKLPAGGSHYANYMGRGGALGLTQSDRAVGAMNPMIASDQMELPFGRRDKGMIYNARQRMDRKALLMSDRASSDIGASGLIWPGEMFITSPYGHRKPKLGWASKMHRGVDMRAERVSAAAPGTVINAGGPWGAVTVDHGNGFTTQYLHLRKIDVKKGDIVEAGQQVGLAGNKAPKPGMAKHLHFSTAFKGKSIDPEILYHSSNSGFSPRYAQDIVKSRQLTAKLSRLPVDTATLKSEEGAGGLFPDSYNPTELKEEFMSLVERSKQRVKTALEENFPTKEKPSAPVVVPVPAAPSTTDVQRKKKPSELDNYLDFFINYLFIDTSLNFANKYKSYVYHSNVGHSFT